MSSSPVDSPTTAKIPDQRMVPSFSDNPLDDRRVLVLGLGASGNAAARLALALGATCQALDGDTNEGLEEAADQLRSLGATACLAWGQEQPLPPADLIVISPGIAPHSPLGRLAWAAAAPVISELEFGARYCTCPVLAVTGTNGKTTTVELTTHLLANMGLRVQSAGNIGLPVSACALASGDLDFLVVEVSSFQLEAVDRFQPAAAALLNVTPDHYDRHGGPEPYLAAKLALLRRMSVANRVVLRGDLMATPGIRQALAGMTGKPLLFAARPDERCDFFADDRTMYERRGGDVVPLAELDELALVGRHNIENALAALALLRAAGQSPQRGAGGLRTFRPSRHRLELVAEHNGVRFVNDSKATNVDALCRALETVGATHPGQRILLVAGGVDKDIDFSAVLPMLENQVREAFLIGTCRARLAKEWQGVVSCQQFLTLEEAVSAASAAARPGDLVLLSPGCASQDMFRNYAHRGDQFRALVKRRAGE
jgi:UDP-N-acetylmuramoylalanine--D-glutamate ligase